MVPTDRESFKEYCLRALGHPVVTVNVTDEQVEDRIDESIKFYSDYHFDGSSRVYFKHQLTQEDIERQFIYLPENIIGVTRLLSGSSMNFTDVSFMAFVNELYSFTQTGTILPFYMARDRLNVINELLVGMKPIRFNRHRNKLHLDFNKRTMVPGTWIVIEAHEALDEESFRDVWGDRWLQNYAIAKIKYQWGTNLSKFSGVALPGGTTLNGATMMAEADARIRELEEDMISSSIPPLDFVG